MRCELACGLGVLVLVGIDNAHGARRRRQPQASQPQAAEPRAPDLDLEPLPLVPPAESAPAIPAEEPSLLPIEPLPPTVPAETAPAPVAPPTPAPGLAETPQPRSPWLTYAGLGAAGLGAIALGVGTYFGGSAASLYDSVTYGPGGTSQLAAGDIDQRVADGDRTANILFGIGGALVGLGALALGLDAFVLAPSGGLVEDGPALGFAGRF